MPYWKLKLLLVAAGWMLVNAHCAAQAGNGADLGRSAASQPQAAASATSRGGSPTPYQAPIVVPSAAGTIVSPRLSLPGVVITPPSTTSFTGNCDSAGCWGSDGTRYNMVGGSLVRPDGRMCQNIGGVMQCQ